MTINDIMEIVHKNYPYEYTRMYWNEERSKPVHCTGDSLAQFIVVEIFETYEEDKTDNEQLARAIQVMEKAEDEVSFVATALRVKRNEILQDSSS